MNDTPANPLPATIMAALRYLIGIAGPWLVAKGYVDAANVDGIAALAVSAATVAYGLYKTHDRQARLVNTPAPSGRVTIR